MKCKDCTVDCRYRASDGEKECEFQNHIIQAPDEWLGVRIQAAIAAMQAIISTSDMSSILNYREKAAKNAVEFADALIEELKKK